MSCIIRYRSDDGFWSNSERRNFFLHQPDPDIFGGRDVTLAEYWFDDLPSITVDINDDPEVVYAALIPSSGLTTNLAHKFSVRYRSTNGYISNTESRYFFLHEPISNLWYGRDITHVEYQFDNLTPVVIDLGNNFEVDYYDLIPAAGLTPNLNHKFSVRYLDEDGKWGNTESRYFFAIQIEGGTVEYVDITHLEYSFDGVNPVLVDVTDGQAINYAELIASLGLQVNQAHKLLVRYKDERGLWSNGEARYVFVHESPDGELTLLDVVTLEYWIDGGAPLQVDIADAASISFADAVAHNVGAGPHSFYLRYLSEEGQRSNTERCRSLSGPARGRVHRHGLPERSTLSTLIPVSVTACLLRFRKTARGMKAMRIPFPFSRACLLACIGSAFASVMKSATGVTHLLTRLWSGLCWSSVCPAVTSS